MHRTLTKGLLRNLGLDGFDEPCCSVRRFVQADGAPRDSVIDTVQESCELLEAKRTERAERTGLPRV
jgi:hypothetical protein